jgi:hypothetical protein
MIQRLMDFDTAPVPRERERPTIQERFEAFDAAHPDVYATFALMAGQLRAAGKTRIGAKRILEVIRYEHDTSGKDTSGWKINNSFSSRFARKLIQSDPTYAPYFETRELKAR